MVSWDSNMTSIPERISRLLLLASLVCVAGCGLERPPDPPPFDCATIDRAAERFPDECGPVVPDDAGEGDAQ